MRHLIICHFGQFCLCLLLLFCSSLLRPWPTSALRPPSSSSTSTAKAKRSEESNLANRHVYHGETQSNLLRRRQVQAGQAQALLPFPTRVIGRGRHPSPSLLKSVGRRSSSLSHLGSGSGAASVRRERLCTVTRQSTRRGVGGAAAAAGSKRRRTNRREENRKRWRRCGGGSRIQAEAAGASGRPWPGEEDNDRIVQTGK